VSRVQSVERAFAVLGALASGPIGVTEVAERARLPKSTAARLLASLAREGAVEQLPGDTRYRLGPRVVSLAAAATPRGSLIGVARAHLETLAEAVGEVAGLSVPDGRTVRYIDQVSVTHQVQVRDWTGTAAPMHAVPSGLVVLATLAPAELAAFLEEPLEALTPKTVTDPSALRRRLDRVRIERTAWVRDEFAEGLTSVAAGIVDPNGRAIAAIHVHGPSYRFPPPGAERAVAGQVLAAADRIAGGLRGG
jgi:IclR family acetate operon transcriptional repressor